MKLIFFLVLIGLPVSLQDFILLDKKKTNANDFCLDELGNLYLIYDTSVERLNAVGGNQFRSSEIEHGNIEYLDVTNPLKPFLHYKDQGKIVLFDNTLSEQGTIDLFENGFGQIEMVCGSRGDAYWLWDARNSEMIRVDQNFTRIASTGNISVLTGMKINPSQIIERGSQLYLRDSTNGILIFDIYGSYRTTLKIATSSDIQIVSDELVYHEADILHVIGKDMISEQKLTLPIHESRRVHYFNQRLYTLSAGEFSIWKTSESTRN